MLDTKPLLRSAISKELWAIKDVDPERFKREVRAYFALGLPDWDVVNAKYPHVYLRDRRG